MNTLVRIPAQLRSAVVTATYCVPAQLRSAVVTATHCAIALAVLWGSGLVVGLATEVLSFGVCLSLSPLLDDGMYRRPSCHFSEFWP